MTLKLNEPQVITATYQIVTPMFIGDAEQKATGISPASVKGALRFWWRALNWGRIRLKVDNDSAALKQLHAEEAILFGSSSYDSENPQRKKDKNPLIGASRFVLKVITSDIKSASLDDPEEGIKYLLGQGLYNFREGVLRKPIQKGTLTIKCVLTKGITEKQEKELEEALMIFGLLGNLGSRARKGFGSLSIQDISSKTLSIPKTKEELKSILEQFSNSCNEPPFTAFSKLTKLHISLEGTKANDLLNDAGMEQQLYRSWGRSINGVHKVGSKDAEQNFPQSHNLMFDVGNRIRPSTIPDKAVFGLPQNYFFSSTKANVEFSLAEKDRSRRASPLFIHVHRFPDGQTILLHTLLQAKFLEGGDKLEFKINRNKNIVTYNSSMTDWGVIDRYLERFTDREVVL